MGWVGLGLELGYVMVGLGLGFEIRSRGKKVGYLGLKYFKVQFDTEEFGLG